MKTYSTNIILKHIKNKIYQPNQYIQQNRIDMGGSDSKPNPKNNSNQPAKSQTTHYGNTSPQYAYQTTEGNRQQQIIYNRQNSQPPPPMQQTFNTTNTPVYRQTDNSGNINTNNYPHTTKVGNTSNNGVSGSFRNQPKTSSYYGYGYNAYQKQPSNLGGNPYQGQDKRITAYNPVNNSSLTLQSSQRMSNQSTSQQATYTTNNTIGQTKSSITPQVTTNQRISTSVNQQSAQMKDKMHEHLFGVQRSHMMQSPRNNVTLSSSQINLKIENSSKPEQVSKPEVTSSKKHFFDLSRSDPRVRQFSEQRRKIPKRSQKQDNNRRQQCNRMEQKRFITDGRRQVFDGYQRGTYSGRMIDSRNRCQSRYQQYRRIDRRGTQRSRKANRYQSSEKTLSKEQNTPKRSDPIDPPNIKKSTNHSRASSDSFQKRQTRTGRILNKNRPQKNANNANLSNQTRRRQRRIPRYLKANCQPERKNRRQRQSCRVQQDLRRKQEHRFQQDLRRKQEQTYRKRQYNRYQQLSEENIYKRKKTRPQKNIKKKKYQNITAQSQLVDPNKQRGRFTRRGDHKGLSMENTTQRGNLIRRGGYKGVPMKNLTQRVNFVRRGGHQGLEMKNLNSRSNLIRRGGYQGSTARQQTQQTPNRTKQMPEQTQQKKIVQKVISESKPQIKLESTQLNSSESKRTLSRQSQTGEKQRPSESSKQEKISTQQNRSTQSRNVGHFGSSSSRPEKRNFLTSQSQISGSESSVTLEFSVIESQKGHNKEKQLKKHVFQTQSERSFVKKSASGRYTQPENNDKPHKHEGDRANNANHIKTSNQQNNKNNKNQQKQKKGNDESESQKQKSKKVYLPKQPQSQKQQIKQPFSNKPQIKQAVYNNKPDFSKKPSNKPQHQIKHQTQSNHHKKYISKQNYEKYLVNSQRLQQSCQQISFELRKLKIYLKLTDAIQNNDAKPTKISIFKSLDYPVLFYEYTILGQKKYLHFSQVQKNIGRKIGEFYEVIKKLYDIHYSAMDQSIEFALEQFAKLKGNELGIRFQLVQSKKPKFQEQQVSSSQQPQNKKLYYYCLNKQNQVQFIYFDLAMKSVEFNSKFIEAKRTVAHGDSYSIMHKFCKQIRNDDTETVFLGQEEIDSDLEMQMNEKQRNNLNAQYHKYDDKLNKIIKTDFNIYDDWLDDLNDENKRLQKYSQSQIQRIQQLATQYDTLDENIDNFIKTKNQIKDKINHNNFKQMGKAKKLESLKIFCKRLIFYKKMNQSDLPILGKKKEIFTLLDKRNLIILEGQTGSGKSTQLPQLLCEYFNLFTNIQGKPVLITQPRRIATRSLAQRVADELEEKCGDFVDYVASGTKTANPKAKIVFKLDRLVLDELVESPTLDEYSCLVIDEAHERTISIDVILGLVKELLQKRKNFKVIITSASMEISLFEKYFNTKTLKVSGRMFPVNVQYLPSKEEDTVKKIEKAIDNELLTERNMLKDKYKGHILVFCADTKEIEALTEIFQRKLNHNVFMVIPLHGKLSPEEQKKAFSKTKEHKLIFASRIAETAITIDGVKVVIDPGWDREMQYDQKTKFSCMKRVEISQSSAKQRAGRAGRTQEGYCLRLYSKYEYQNRRPNKLPQIKNIALQTLVLRLKVLGVNNVESFNYIEKPDESGIKTSIQTLKMIGCLDEKEKVTTIGRFLVKIPIEPFLSRSIIEALLMQKTLKIYPHIDRKYSNLTSAVIQILCMTLNSGNLFRISPNYRQLAERIKYERFSNEKGDFFYLRRIYQKFKSELRRGDKRGMYSWLNQHFLIKKTLIQVTDLVKEIEQVIEKFHINQHTMRSDLLKCRRKLQLYKSEEDRILSCLTTSFATNLCLYTGHALIGYTYINLQKLVTIYGTSCLSLIGKCPKWILAYDFYQNQQGKMYCRVANQVTYDFMKNTVEEYVFKKYRISQAQKSNPYYRQIVYRLETLLLIQLKEAYMFKIYYVQNRKDFMKNLDVNFSEEQNTMTVFVKCEEKNQNVKLALQVELENYIAVLRKKAAENFCHNYVNNVYAQIQPGFGIKSLEFKNVCTVFEITHAQNQVLNSIRIDWSHKLTIQNVSADSLKIYIDDDDEIASFNSYIDWLNYKQFRFVLNQSTQQKSKKTHYTQIYLNWYAGISTNDTIVINYWSHEFHIPENQLIQITQKNCRYINEALEQLHNEKKKLGRSKKNLFQEELSKIKDVRMTKDKKGINFFRCKLDQVELRKFLTKLIKEGVIDALFTLPKIIKKFRQPDFQTCAYSQQLWILKVHNLIQKYSSKQTIIEVHGTKYRPKDNKKQSEFEKSFFIELSAIIKTFDRDLLRKLKRLDGKQGVLGTEKVHIDALFAQSIEAIDGKVFKNLKDEYKHEVQILRAQYPGLQVIQQTKYQGKKNGRGIPKVYITIGSYDRQHLLQPLRVLNDLFTPRFIKLTDFQIKYLKQYEGEKILQQIQSEHDFRIFFKLDFDYNLVQLFCRPEEEDNIKIRLKYALSKIKLYEETISYKGRNLKKIEQIIKKKQEQIKRLNIDREQKLMLIYEIIFTTRKIRIIGDEKTFNQVRMQIMQIKIEESSNNCQICCQLMLTPYKLFNCKHTFCWSCLAEIIKQFKTGQTTSLKCQFYDQETNCLCNKLISIYDVSKILSEQELQQVFDVQILKFVETHPKQYVKCLTSYCCQVFDRAEVEDEIDCEQCGKNYCLKCNQSHRGYGCREWGKTMENQLKRLGIQKCPKCGQGIQREVGCLKIACRCGANVCWKCLEYFETSKQCYNHLAKVHQRINE